MSETENLRLNKAGTRQSQENQYKRNNSSLLIASKPGELRVLQEDADVGQIGRLEGVASCTSVTLGRTGRPKVAIC